MFIIRKNDPEFIKWAKDVKTRDNFTCQICGRRGIPLESHHKNSWDTFEELRFDLNNGITLCVDCHTRFHEQYGWGSNDEIQFNQYYLIAKSFVDLINKKNGK